MVGDQFRKPGDETRHSHLEAQIMQLHLSHDQNLASIAGQLFVLQSNLIAKEKYLGQVLQDRDQTIMEQQRVIRRLLRKGHSYQFKDTDVKEEISPTNSDAEENEAGGDGIPIEISISVPNLSEIKLVRPPVLRSISNNEDGRKCRLKFDRRAKNREKLMSMKRYSGFLKRPEILETVYSVESEDGNDGGKPVEGGQDKTNDATKDQKEKKEEEIKPRMKLAMLKRLESENTEYSCSTDSESLRYIFSETDQSVGSEICSRRSSSGSQPSIDKHGAGLHGRGRSWSMEDLQGRKKLLDKRKILVHNSQSVSLDYVEG